jgi:hypothetical protein
MSKPKWLDLKEVQRWATLRCEHCGHRFRWKRDPRHSFGNRDGKVYHGPCMAYLTWRAKADERMFVLGVMSDLTSLGDADIKTVVEMRATDEAERVAHSNISFRVFYDKQQGETP